MKVLVAAAAACGLVLVLAGAAGGHAAALGIGDGSMPGRLAKGVILHISWESAMQFGLAHVMAALLAALLRYGRLSLWAGWLFLAGVVLFSFPILARTLGRMNDRGDDPLSWVGAMAPLGGVAFMLGWALLAAGALRSGKDA